jgi:hypothetical protein
MNGGYGIASNGTVSTYAVGSLHVCCVEGGEGGEIGLHRGGKGVVGGVLGGPEGCAAAAAWGAGEEFETCVGGRLEFVGHLCFSAMSVILLLWGKGDGRYSHHYATKNSARRYDF